MPSVEQRLTDLERTLNWWRGLSVSLAIILVGMVVMLTLIGRRVMSGSVAAARGDFQRLRARSVEVTDAKGNVVVSLQEAAGGGMVGVSSSTPNDHDVLILANPTTANVQVSHQGAPRQFGLFTIIQRKPVVQVYEETQGPGMPKDFHQFPTYAPRPTTP